MLQIHPKMQELIPRVFWAWNGPEERIQQLHGLEAAVYPRSRVGTDRELLWGAGGHRDLLGGMQWSSSLWPFWDGMDLVPMTLWNGMDLVPMTFWDGMDLVFVALWDGM